MSVNLSGESNEESQSGSGVRPSPAMASSGPPRAADAGDGDPGPDLVGRVVGHVRLEALIDRGGMGEVYRGFDETLERKVAVKAIRGEQRMDDMARSRFRREARLLSKLEHPNICRIYDLREGDDDGDFLILELIEGTKLGDYIGSEVSFEAKLEIAEQIASALASAHELRIVHRDLKPNNVMITGNGRVKVLDFGLARSLERGPEGFLDPPTPMSSSSKWIPLDSSTPGASSQSLLELRTGSELMVGTLLFMSPEQAFGEALTEASDLYAFGLLLQWMFTGVSPYGAPTNQLDLLKRVLQGDTQPVEGLDPDLTELIEELKRPNADLRPDARACMRRLRRLADKPSRLRRRRGLLAVGISVAIIVALIVVFGRHQERQRMAAAVELTHEVKDIEWLMRLARSVPAHDLRPQKNEVRWRMGRIEGRVQTGGRWERGPALYALGRGHWALGEIGVARSYLERARQEGYRRPEVAFALGSVLGHAYHDARAEGISCLDGAWCAERERWLVSNLLVPAARHLREGRAPGAGLVAYSEALLAYFEGRLDDAAGEIGQASQAAWLHEAPLLAGHVEQARGVRSDSEGDSVAADLAYGSARRSYLEALEVGSSDPRVYLALCRLSLRLARRHIDAGEDPEARMTEADEACATAQQIDPEYPAALVGSAQGLLLRVIRSLAVADAATADVSSASAGSASAGSASEGSATERVPGSPVASLQQALDLLRRAEALDPASASVPRLQARAYGLWAQLRRRSGADPEQTSTAALQQGRRATTLDPLDPGSIEARVAAGLALAHWQAESGLDPQPVLIEATRSLRGLLRAHRGFARAHTDLARIYWLRAMDERRRGRDGEDLLAAALVAVAQALEIDPEEPRATYLRAELEAAVQPEPAVSEDEAPEPERGADPAALF